MTLLWLGKFIEFDDLPLNIVAVYKISWRDIMLIMFMEWYFRSGYNNIPSGNFKIAIEHGPSIESIVDLPMINDDFP